MRRGAATRLAGMLLCGGAALAAAAVPAPQFPADTGSHAGYRTEWWYVTGWLETATDGPLGFQVTFFRTRPDVADDSPSDLAARELVIAHAAISDPRRGALERAQRIERAVLGLAGADAGATHVWIDRWSLARSGADYVAEVDDPDVGMSLHLDGLQPPLLNGEAGLSRKGSAASATSWYYSEPHLRVHGTVRRAGRPVEVHGEAWLDHEWSNAYLEPGAVGWDWIGINLDDGGALMAFRIRGADGQPRWAGATLRTADGLRRTFAPDAVSFEPLRHWTSPRTAIDWPVGWRVRVGGRELTLSPLMPDQENDTRQSSGAIYWEGAVEASEAGRRVGRGYLELTGYGERLKLP